MTSRSVSSSASRGCAAPAARANGAARVPRTCARAPSTPVGTPTEDSPTCSPLRPRSSTISRTDADPVTTAPLLCAGIIGFRALSRANLPPGGRLGLYGFGSSAHLVAQIAIASGASVSVMTRGEQNRALARELGAEFVGEEATPPPQPLDSAIVFAPAGGLVPVALAATRSGGTVVLAGIEMSDIPSMSYDASLFRERDLRTVTANTRDDGRRLLDLAANLALRPAVTKVPFAALDSAIDDIRDGRARGSLVLLVEDRDAP